MRSTLLATLILRATLSRDRAAAVLGDLHEELEQRRERNQAPAWPQLWLVGSAFAAAVAGVSLRSWLAARGIERYSQITAGRFYDLLDELELSQRAVFTLFELDGLSGEEIAELLAIPLGTVYSRLRLARETFRRTLERQRAQEHFRMNAVRGTP